MILKFYRFITQMIAVFVAIILLISLPFLFGRKPDGQEFSFQPSAFWERIVNTFDQFFHLNSIEYIHVAQATGEVTRRALFPDILNPYFYSLTLLFIAFCIALIVATLFGFMYFLASTRWKRITNSVLFVLESIPDIMIMICLQLFFIWIFKKTDILMFRIANFNEKRAYVIPIICLCILPTIQLFRMFIACLDDEKTKPYVEVVRGKGFSHAYIMYVHLFRNVLIHMFHHSKTIFLFMLSNLLILEIIFNMNGVMNALIDLGKYSPTGTIVVLVMIFFPFYFFFAIGSIFIKRISKESEGQH
ncbi:ABC transporter permease subunit [Microbacteriaceae bacterium 4G12]